MKTDYLWFIKLLFIVFVFQINPSCNKKPTYNFIEQIELKGKNIGPNGYFLKPIRCIYDHGYLVVIDQNRNNIFHFLNEEFELFESWGKIGNGPNELSSYPNISQQPFLDYNTISYYDPNKNNLGLLYFSNDDDKIKIVLAKQFKLPQNIYFTQNIQRISSDRFVAIDCPQLGKLGFFNIGDSAAKFSPFIPKSKYIENNRNIHEFYNGDISFQKGPGKVVYVNRMFNQLEIYDTNGNLLKEIHPNKEIVESQKPGKNFYYNAVSTTENYIYASYLGVDSKLLNLKNMNILKTKIQVFNWEGEPIAEMKTGKLTGYFAVDNFDRFLICIDETNYEQPLILFDIPKFKHK